MTEGAFSVYFERLEESLGNLKRCFGAFATIPLSLVYSWLSLNFLWMAFLPSGLSTNIFFLVRLPFSTNHVEKTNLKTVRDIFFF